MEAGSMAQQSGSSHESICAFVSRAQVIASHFLDATPREDLVSIMRTLAADIPEVSSRAEQLVIEAVLNVTLKRLYVHCGCLADADSDAMTPHRFHQALDRLSASSRRTAE